MNLLSLILLVVQSEIDVRPCGINCLFSVCDKYDVTYKIPHKSCHSFPLFRKVINVMGFLRLVCFMLVILPTFDTYVQFSSFSSLSYIIFNLILV